MTDLKKRLAFSALLFPAFASPSFVRSPIRKIHYSNTIRNDNFQWTDIVPAPQLQYHDCYDGFQCARLQVPLDWNNTNPSLIDNAAIAIIRLPAQVNVTDLRYGGAILINPGGPGESGVLQALNSAQSFQTIFDAAYINGSDSYLSNNTDAKYFDIIGFDPRGVNNSTPFVSCFATESEYLSWSLQTQNQLGTPEGPYDLLWQQNVALNNECFVDPMITPNGTLITDFITTASTARDMVEIIERHGEWREQQTTDSEDQQRIAWQKGEEPILYYGVSYGTILGATLATMQPHRVNRMILDGVASSSQYYAGNFTTDNVDRDATFELFFEYCALAGPENCTMWAGNSSDATKQVLVDISNNLTRNGPLAVAGQDGVGATVITLSALKNIVGSPQFLYAPLTGFPTFANVVGPLYVGNGTFLAQALYSPLPPIPLNDTIDPYDPSTGPNYFAPQLLQGTATSALVGSDSTTRRTEEQYKAVWDELRNVSTWNGDHLATLYMFISSWPGAPKWRYGDTQPIASNVTANPILFASNVIDPATSLASAREMNAAFAGSGLLLNDGEGHTTAVAPSLCVVKKFREYFQTGKLPFGLDETCLPYVRPFLGEAGPRTAPFNPEGASLEDLALFNASLSYTG